VYRVRALHVESGFAWAWLGAALGATRREAVDAARAAAAADRRRGQRADHPHLRRVGRRPGHHQPAARKAGADRRRLVSTPERGAQAIVDAGLGGKSER
jgi:hypothetical protein